MGNLIVMAVKPSFADAVYKGEKLYEYRRVRAKINQGDRVLIYETSPVSKITGQFIAGKVWAGRAKDMFRLEPGDRIQALVTEYLKGAKVVTAIEITHATKWKSPQLLSVTFPNIPPPQSYIFIKE